MGHTLVFGPADHGRFVTASEWERTRWREGYDDEHIGGRITAAPAADLTAGRLENWLDRRLRDYSVTRPDIINQVFTKAREFVPGRPELTVPEADVAAYHDFPTEESLEGMTWADVAPVLVVEVLSRHNPAKDLRRNVRLYGRVTGVREYWIVDHRTGADTPSLIVYRRQASGRRGRRRLIPFGAVYTSPHLPGFALTADPRPTTDPEGRR